jgi:glutamate synthase (NADPH/NADH) large chain
MSGGIAYALDLDPANVNREMVDLDPLDDTDREFLAATIARHAEETESDVAARLLAEGDAAIARFSKVMPKDFKRVLAARAAAEAEGLTGDDVTRRVMEASA